MKRVALILAAAGLFLVSPARADITLGLQGAVAIPTGGAYSSGIGGSLAAGWSWNPRFALELCAGLWPVPATASTGGLGEGSLGVFPVEVSFRVRWPLGPKLRVSGDAGLGYAFYCYSLDEEIVAAWKAVGFEISEAVKDAPAAHIGCGLEYVLSKNWAVTLGLRYHVLRTRGTWSISDDISGETQSGKIKNLNFDAFSLSLGIRIGLFVAE
ncbi:MAG: outer membrane beta-barrel protein [Candidatus Aminicenantales bacterium]